MWHKQMYSQPGYLIRRLHQRSTAEFAAVTSGHDVTQIQFSILLVIQDIPGIDATRISELIGSDRTTIRQALLLLERKELIRRKMGAHDRRTKSLVITDKGQELVASIDRSVQSLGDAILSGLNGRERKMLTKLMTKLVAQNEGGSAVGENGN